MGPFRFLKRKNQTRTPATEPPTTTRTAMVIPAMAPVDIILPALSVVRQITETGFSFVPFVSGRVQYLHPGTPTIPSMGVVSEQGRQGPLASPEKENDAKYSSLQLLHVLGDPCVQLSHSAAQLTHSPLTRDQPGLHSSQVVTMLQLAQFSFYMQYTSQQGCYILSCNSCSSH